MFGDRSDIRQVYFNVWQKIQDTQAVLEPMEMMIADVIKLHPEYHAFLQNDAALSQDFTPEQGQTNPFLHMGMHIAIREQISTNRPIGIKAYYMKQCKLKDMHDVEHQMMECLGEALWKAQRNNENFDELAYMQCIKS